MGRQFLESFAWFCLIIFQNLRKWSTDGDGSQLLALLRKIRHIIYTHVYIYIYIYVYIHVDILVCTAVVNIVAISSKYVYPYLYSIFNIHARYLPLSMSKGFALPWCYFTFWLSALRPHGRSLFQSLPVSAWVGGAARGCSIEMIEIRENVDEMNLEHLFTFDWNFKVAPARLASSHRCWYLLLFIWSWFGRGSARCHCFEYVVALTKYEAIRTVRTVVATNAPQGVRFGTKPWSARPSARPFIDTFWHLQALVVDSLATLPSTWSWSNFAVPNWESIGWSSNCLTLVTPCDLNNFALRRLGCTGRTATLGGIPSDQCVLPQTGCFLQWTT